MSTSSTNVFMSSTEVKSYLGLSTASTTYDTDISIYTPIVWEDIKAITNNKFEEAYHWFQDDELVISSSNKTITIDTASTNDFNRLVQVGDTIQVSKTWFNDGSYSVASFTTHVLTVNESLIDENSTDYQITSFIFRVDVPNWVKAVGAKMIWYSLNNKTNVSGKDVKSERYGDYSVTYGTGDKASVGSYGGYPRSLINSLAKVRKVRTK